MGDYISILDGLIVTLFSMLAVFIVLIMISFLINALKIISNDNKVKQDKEIEIKNEEEPVPDCIVEDKIEEELVAVIAASVAVNLGLNIPDIRIKSIKRVPQNLNLWTSVGRKEQVLNRR